MKTPAALFSLCLCVVLSLVGCGSENVLTPSAALSVSPSSLTFAATMGQTSSVQTVTLTNTGTGLAALDTFVVSGAAASDFAIAANTCGNVIGSTASCTVTISFTPTATGLRSASLHLTSAISVVLTGNAASVASIALTPSTLTFASTAINQTATAQTLTVTNSGGTAATLATPTVTGLNASDFVISGNTCGNAIAAASTCTYSVAFTPTTSGTRAATFTLNESSLGIANTYTASLSGTGTPSGLGLEGTVLSGAHPVQNATIQLYTVGATGNGSAAHAMLSSTVTTNAAGNFYLATGSPLALAFTCTHPTDQVYAVAAGGNPGISSTNNAALTMVTALGNCNTLTTTSSITINELTTVAAAWTLAQFAASTTNIGASSTNAAGIHNAMLNAQLLATSSTGAVATPASNLNVEPGKLAALADALASCTDSDGTACTPLFTAATPAGGTAPTDAFAAALSIVKNPSQNIAAVYALLGNTPPYATSLTQAPNDWTLNMAVSGGALAAPTDIAIDSSGNIWAADYAGLLSGFSPQGTPLSATGYGSGKLDEVLPHALTIDPSGNIWASDQVDSVNSTGSITKFTPSGTGTFSSITKYYDASINYPTAVAADTNGNIFIANYATSAVTVYTGAGVPLATHGTGLGSGSALEPVAVAADANHGVWIANSESAAVTHVSATGLILSNLACCAGANGSNGIATDSAGNAWISDYGASAFSVISTSASGDAILINEQPLLGPGLVSAPSGLAVDAAQNVFVANLFGESITELAGIHSTRALGTQLSPPTGFGYPASGSPRVLSPEAVAPDASGNLWVTNNGNNNLIVFFGLAAPTKTPVVPTPIYP